MAASVWITRPEPGNTRTVKSLRRSGVSAISVPVLAVATALPPGFVPTPAPDWILFVSRNAVAGLDLLWASFSDPSSKSAVRTAAVGKQTAAFAAKRGWKVETVPETENAKSLAEALAGENLTRQTVWIPSGNRGGSARQILPDRLRALGAEVRVIPVYETRARIPVENELRRLENAEPGAVVIHSASSAEVVFSDAVPPAFYRWRLVPAVCIGGATAARAGELGAKPVIVCPEPSDKAVLDVLRSIQGLGLERKIL